MKTRLLPVILASLVMGNLPVVAQIPIIPSKTVEETQGDWQDGI